MHWFRYIPWLVGQVLVGAWAIAKDSFTPGSAMQPVVIRYPLRVHKERDIAAFSTSITMTPGTMSIGLADVAEDGRPKTLLVHAVYGADPDGVIAGLADMEERLKPEVKSIPRPGYGHEGETLGDAIVAAVDETPYPTTIVSPMVSIVHPAVVHDDTEPQYPVVTDPSEDKQ